MRDEILIRVMLPANRLTYEFLMPLDLTVRQGAQIVSRILAAQERARYCSSEECDLMMVDGPHPGLLLEWDTTFRELSVADRLVDGALLVLM